MVNKINRDEPDSLGGLFPAAIRGLISGLITSIILALILSAVALAMDDPSSMIGLFALISLFLGAVVNGFTAAKAYPDGRLVAAILSGAIYVLFIWLISLFFRGQAGATEAVSPLGMALGYAGCIALAALGGLIARPRTKSYSDVKKSPSAQLRKKMKIPRR